MLYDPEMLLFLGQEICLASNWYSSMFPCQASSYIWVRVQSLQTSTFPPRTHAQLFHERLLVRQLLPDHQVGELPGAFHTCAVPFRLAETRCLLSGDQATLSIELAC